MPSQRRLRAPCPGALGSGGGAESLAKDPWDPLARPLVRRGAPGRGRGTVLQSGARSMGRAAVAGGGAGGAHWWLPWLGLCFWATGATAARGKRRAKRAGGLGARRGEGRQQDQAGPTPPALASQVAPCTSPRTQPNRVGISAGTTAFHPKFAIIRNPTGCCDRAPTLYSPRLLHFPIHPQLLQTGVPTSSLQSRSPPFSPLPSKGRSFMGGRP